MENTLGNISYSYRAILKITLFYTVSVYGLVDTDRSRDIGEDSHIETHTASQEGIS
jgi:uncharacterized alkaline shock family protein YloU